VLCVIVLSIWVRLTQIFELLLNLKMFLEILIYLWGILIRVYFVVDMSVKFT